MKNLPLKHALLSLALFSVFAAGCSLVGEGFHGEVTGRAEPAAEPPALLLHNETNRTVHYFVAEKGDLALTYIKLSPCAERPSIAAGETARIPYEDIALYDQGDTTAWVEWCVVDETGDTFTVSLR